MNYSYLTVLSLSYYSEHKAFCTAPMPTPDKQDCLTHGTNNRHSVLFSLLLRLVFWENIYEILAIDTTS